MMHAGTLWRLSLDSLDTLETESDASGSRKELCGFAGTGFPRLKCTLTGRLTTFYRQSTEEARR